MKFLVFILGVLASNSVAHAWSSSDRFSCRGANWEYVDGSGILESQNDVFLSHTNEMLTEKFDRDLGYGKAKVISKKFVITYDKGGTLVLSSDQDNGKLEHTGLLTIPGHQTIQFKCRWNKYFFNDAKEINKYIKKHSSQPGYWGTFKERAGLINYYEEPERAANKQNCIETGLSILKDTYGVFCRRAGNTTGKVLNVLIVKSYTHCESQTEESRTREEPPLYDCYLKALVKCSEEVIWNGEPISVEYD